MAFTMRLKDEVDIEKFDKIAQLHGLGRTAFLNELLIQTIERGFVPMFPGEGYRATAQNGGIISLTIDEGFVSSGSNGLTDKEKAVFEQTKKLVQAGWWYQAKNCLLEAGFEVQAIGRE